MALSIAQRFAQSRNSQIFLDSVSILGHGSRMAQAFQTMTNLARLPKALAYALDSFYVHGAKWILEGGINALLTQHGQKYFGINVPPNGLSVHSVHRVDVPGVKYPKWEIEFTSHPDAPGVSERGPTKPVKYDYLMQQRPKPEVPEAEGHPLTPGNQKLRDSSWQRALSKMIRADPTSVFRLNPDTKLNELSKMGDYVPWMIKQYRSLSPDERERFVGEDMPALAEALKTFNKNSRVLPKDKRDLMAYDIPKLKSTATGLRDDVVQAMSMIDPTSVFQGGEMQQDGRRGPRRLMKPGTNLPWLIEAYKGLAPADQQDIIEKGEASTVLGELNTDIRAFLSPAENAKLPEGKRTLDQISGFKELHTLLNPEKKEKLKGNITVWLNSDKWLVLTPHDEASSRLYGSSDWCTAYPDRSTQYKNYTSRGPLYIFRNKKNPNEMYQLHWEDGQFVKKDDRTTSFSKFIAENPEVGKALGNAFVPADAKPEDIMKDAKGLKRLFGLDPKRAASMVPSLFMGPESPAGNPATEFIKNFSAADVLAVAQGGQVPVERINHAMPPDSNLVFETAQEGKEPHAWVMYKTWADLASLFEHDKFAQVLFEEPGPKQTKPLPREGSTVTVNKKVMEGGKAVTKGVEVSNAAWYTKDELYTFPEDPEFLQEAQAFLERAGSRVEQPTKEAIFQALRQVQIPAAQQLTVMPGPSEPITTQAYAAAFEVGRKRGYRNEWKKHIIEQMQGTRLHSNRADEIAHHTHMLTPEQLKAMHFSGEVTPDKLEPRLAFRRPVSALAGLVCKGGSEGQEPFDRGGSRETNTVMHMGQVMIDSVVSARGKVTVDDAFDPAHPEKNKKFCDTSVFEGPDSLYRQNLLKLMKVAAPAPAAPARPRARRKPAA
jgi:hypothetical protein